MKQYDNAIMPSLYETTDEESQKDSTDGGPIEDFKTFCQRLTTDKCPNDDFRFDIWINEAEIDKKE